MSEQATPLISIVDDDVSVREATEALMRSLGFRAQSFPSASAFLSSSAIKNTSCLIADINMPKITGVELYRRLVGSGYAIPTILITAYPDDETRVRSPGDGVVCYLTKPFDDEVLLGCLRVALGTAEEEQHD
ncbi:response regulator [Mesorhizobium sp. M0816]|uniref:response regulator transcription factor n=1 Tax=Mesorhizobium sp. M0816 TaxID=2957006 RepID=UPI003334DD5E